MIKSKGRYVNSLKQTFFCLLLILVFTLGAGISTFAAENTETSAGKEQNNQTKAKPMSQSGYIPFIPILDEWDMENSYLGAPCNPISFDQNGSEPNRFVQLCHIEKGAVEFFFKNDPTQGFWPVKPVGMLGIYKDQALTIPISEDSEHRIHRYLGTFVVQVPEDGEYYVGIQSTAPLTKPQTFDACAFFYSGKDRTIYNKNAIIVGSSAPQTTNYFKFKAKYTGYLRVKPTYKKYSGGYNSRITLLNGKKQKLSNDVLVDCTEDAYGDPFYDINDVAFGVKKGKTYYIKINQPKVYNGWYKLWVNNVKVSEKSGSKKSKAVLIKKNKTKTGTVTAGSSSKADWYKFKPPVNKFIQLKVTGKSNKKFRVKIYHETGVLFHSSTINRGEGLVWDPQIPLYKGTYYIKICGADKESSGYYKIKWKTK